MEKGLYLTEVFCSVQGETSFAGLPTTFIRLSGCNLRCTWCDTPYSFKRGNKWSLEDIVDKVSEHGCHHVCVTGGEPLLQSQVHSLMEMLCDRGYTVSIETGGSLPIESIDRRVHIILDLKCPGSGMELKNCWANLDLLKVTDEVKFVIKDEADYQYACHIVKKYALDSSARKVLFSPVHGQLSPKLLVEWILRDKIQVRLNLQIHKVIWDPATIGV